MTHPSRILVLLRFSARVTDSPDGDQLLEGIETMGNPIYQYLQTVTFGDFQKCDNMVVAPLFAGNGNGPNYLTLSKALEEKSISVTEVDEEEVSELKVVNEADLSVLLLDGEELIGAMQNRVLNTSILLKEHSTTIIPVSCTEQGRWDEESEEFADSDVVMSPRIRSAKTKSVSAALEEEGRFLSDQGEVWNEIEALSRAAETDSPTGAMRDVFESKKAKLERYLQSFQSLPGQKGLLVFINGRVIGLDILSRDDAYARLAPKLVKSYAIDALLATSEDDGPASLELAEMFLREAADTRQHQFESVGHGIDYRYRSGIVVGSALVVDEVVVHAAFFRVKGDDNIDLMADTTRRRRFRE